MAITNAFKDAIAEQEIQNIRIMMKNSLLVDPTFQEFDDMQKMAQNIQGLYDAHDGRELLQEKSMWDDQYMNTLMVQVMGNFSHERINHLKSVVHYLLPVSQNKPKSQKTSNNTSPMSAHSDQKNDTRLLTYKEQKHQDEKNGRIIHRCTKITIGTITGAIVGGTIGQVAGNTISTVAIGAFTGAVVFGVAVAIATNGEQ